MARVDRLVSALRRDGFTDDAPAALFFVPGRLELIGKHVDYAGGRSLTCATEQGLLMVVCPATDPDPAPTLRWLDVGRGERAALALAPSQSSRIANRQPPPWSRYAAAVIGGFPEGAIAGATVAFESDLPSAAGMSSSSAMIVAAWLAIAFAAEHAGHAPPSFPRAPEGLAGALGAIESGAAIGTRGGAQDHAAILLAKADHVLQARYAPERVERHVALPADFRFVVLPSGVRAAKATVTREAFNRLADQAHALGATPVLGPYLDGSVDRAALLTDAADTPDLRRRMTTLLDEVDDVSAAGDAIARHDLSAFAARVAASQARAELVLGNQTEETVFLVDAALRGGALAASSMGAGFGGAVWALVPADDADDFAGNWHTRYARAFPERIASDTLGATSRTPPFLVSRAGPPAQRVI